MSYQAPLHLTNAPDWQPEDAGIRLNPQGAKGRLQRAIPPVDPPEDATWLAEGLSRVDRIVAFCNSLPIPLGAGVGTNMQLLPFQVEIISALYGSDGVRECVISIPRKNGKTGLCAALLLAHMVGPEQIPGGRYYSAASSRDQAGIIFDLVSQIIEITPWLRNAVARKAINIQRHRKLIEVYETRSSYTALAADSATVHGLNVSFAIYDECSQAKSVDLYDAISTAAGAQENAKLICISTASPDPNHFFSQRLAYGQQVASGAVIDPAFRSFVWAAPEDADIFDPEVWAAANPALGKFRLLTDFEARARQAEHIPSNRNAFKNLFLNMAVDLEPAFLPQSDWEACKVEDTHGMREGECYAGLDLSALRDLTCLALYWPATGFVEFWVWVPAETAENVTARARIPYTEWAEMGACEICDGRSINYDQIVASVQRLDDQYHLEAIAFDRWNISVFERALAERDMSIPMIPFGQGYKDMSPAINKFEAAIVSKELKHDGNPLVNWTFSNLAVDFDPAANRKFSKSRSRDRIDPIIAAVQAVAASQTADEPVEFGSFAVNI